MNWRYLRVSKTKTFTSKAIVVNRICVHGDHSIGIEIAPKMVWSFYFHVCVCFGYLSMECGLFRCEEKRVQRYIVFFTRFIMICLCLCYIEMCQCWNVCFVWVARLGRGKWYWYWTDSSIPLISHSAEWAASILIVLPFLIQILIKYSQLPK